MWANFRTVSSPRKGGDLYVTILDSLGKPPEVKLIKTNTLEGGSMEVEIYFGFKLIRKPKTKKITVAIDSEQ